MEETIEFPANEPYRTAALLLNAREATGLNQADAGQLVGVAEGTVRNWETAAGKGAAIKPILYMRELARRSTLARAFILSALELAESDLSLDKKREARLDLYREAFGSADEIVQAQIRATELILIKQLRGESDAASA